MNIYIKFCFVLASFCLLVSFSGCGKPPQEKSSAAKAYDPKTDPLVNPASLLEPVPEDKSKIEDGETLILQLDGSPNTLHPLFLSSLVESTVSGTLFTGLFTFDKDMNWMVNDELVEDYQENENLTEITVKMKKGFTWQDGHPLTVHDIVYSWQQILDPAVPCQTQKPSVEPIEECIALDDYTIKFIQSKPLATARWNLLFPIIPKHLFEKEKKNNPDLKTGDYFNKWSRHPVGNGPYKIVEWKENDKVVVERWEDYKGFKPYFKQIIFKIIPDTNITLLSFEKEDIDVVRKLTSQQFAKETNTESFKKVGYKAWGTQWAFSYIGWNMDGSNPFFNDKKVRLAMTHALNIPLILEKIAYNLSSQSLGVYHEDSWMYNPDVKPFPFDLKIAGQLLDEAGWAIDPTDGWRYKTINGEKVLFKFTLTMPQGSQTSPKIAAIFQEDLKLIGVQMDTRVLEWATYMEKSRKHEFQAGIAAWGTGADPDTGWNLWRTDQYKTGRNYGGYSNPEIDKLFEEGRAEFDFEKRKKIYQKIHKILYEDQPYIWISNPPILSAINKRIRGVQFSPRGIFSFDPSFYGWWVMKGQAKYAVMQKP